MHNIDILLRYTLYSLPNRQLSLNPANMIHEPPSAPHKPRPTGPAPLPLPRHSPFTEP